MSSDTTINHVMNPDDTTVDGMVDYAGRPAIRCQSGYWRSASFIIGVGAAERFAYYGISSNLITYLTGPLGQSTAAAAASINIWAGTGLLLPLLGALVADSFLGRYWTIVCSSLLYILALGLLTTSAFLNCQGGGGCSILNPQQPPNELDNHALFFFMSLYLMALAQGAHKPCILAFGADQFDAQHPKELRSRSSFFNWWYFSICAGPLAALLVLNYIQDNISWGIGFGIPCISMVIALTIFMLGTKSYRYNSNTVEQKCALSSLTQFLIKAAMNWTSMPNEAQVQDIVPHDLPPSDQQQFVKSLNRALVSAEYEEVCSTQEVEEAKALVKLIPIWATSLAFAIVLAQPSTLFTKQGIKMDRWVGSSFEVPAASIQYIIGLTIILVIPIYDRVFVPLARVITGKPCGITDVERIGTGMFICSVSMVTAALVERQRLKKTASAYGLGKGKEAMMSFWWLIPQCILYGMADVFALIGLQELFYDKVPCGLKSVGLSIFLSILGMGNFLSSLLICMIERVSSEGGGEGGWFSDNTNGAHLDYFYWLLAGLNAIGFVGFLYSAKQKL
ncbi:protein NRT1/ PTR FAMILY 5.10-like isoform X2 [Sesamum indicum]|uniref:Protein NRT1/ PTR FAMILY 5.10-like isoform X2 n=1 Tax=Sesamum indicum TaxID=4182 RepID=A0A6I9SXB6_SESIN|nr:protein NRT1/ PTR FAMILY 5.10-like isoform X2 [Sesamum indicum]